MDPTSTGGVIFRFFWLICGLWCGLGGALQTKLMLRKKVAAGAFTQDEVDRFSFWLAVCFLAPTLTLWLIQGSIGGDTTPAFLDWPEPQRLMALVVVAVVWGSSLVYVFAMDGAQTLARFSAGKRARPSLFQGPTVIKVQTVAFVLVGSVAMGAYSTGAFPHPKMPWNKPGTSAKP